MPVREASSLVGRLGRVTWTRDVNCIRTEALRLGTFLFCVRALCLHTTIRQGG